MHDCLPVDVLCSQVNIELFHESFQGFDLAKSANIVYELGALLPIDNIIVNWEFSSEGHHDYRKERALDDGFADVYLSWSVRCLLLHFMNFVLLQELDPVLHRVFVALFINRLSCILG